MYQKLRNKQNILFYFVLLTLINSISSSSISYSDEDSSSSSDSNLSTNLDKEDADGALPKQLFAQYRESYITKEDAQLIRKRIHDLKKSNIDYDDLLHDKDDKPKKFKKVKSDIYEKKYFDYLPAEDESESENEGHHKKSGKKHHHSKHRQHNKNSKQRSRRDTTDVLDNKEISAGADKNVVKRQSQYVATQKFINNERGYYYPVPANPWTDSYYQNHRPYINRHYLPAASPIYILPPLQPFGEYPSSPPHHNIAHPPVNPPPNSQIVTESPMDLVNRFDGDEDRPVWEMWDINEPNSIQIVQPNRPQPTRRPPPSILRTTTQEPQRVPTRRPAPPIIRNPVKEIAEDTRTTANSLNAVQSGSSSNRVPELGPAFQSDNRPRPLQPDNIQQTNGPSRCVWGIVTCCKRGSLALRYNCFENLGCGGAFWDYNPCSTDILDAALEQTNQYFN